MTRKISENAVNAFMNDREFRASNTTVTRDRDGTAMYLHGNKIAVKGSTGTCVTLAGRNTPTTRERLNTLVEAINGTRPFYTRKGVPYFNDVAINAEQWVQL